MGLLPFGREGGQATRTFPGQDAPAIGNTKPSPPVGWKIHAAKYPAPLPLGAAGGLVDCNRLETCGQPELLDIVGALPVGEFGGSVTISWR